MPSEMLEEHRAALSAIQCVSQDFRGFTESQLDELLPFLDFIDFSEGQEIVTQGEDASWFGLLLGGQLEVRHGSHVLATLTPGRIVGEMAFFRGGKRGASMIGISAGTVAAVQFGSMPRLFEKSATTATTLVRAMGRAAVRKMEQIQEIIPRTSEAVLRLAMAVGSFRGGAGAGAGATDAKQSRFDKARAALEKRGLSAEEVSMLFDGMRILQFHAGQTIMLREHTLGHFGIVLHGSVEQGFAHKKTAQPGDFVGEYEVLSGHPLPANVVGGPSGGVIGMLNLDLSELNEPCGGAKDGSFKGGSSKGGGKGGGKGGKDSSGGGGSSSSSQGLLAMRLYKLLGIAATSADNSAIDEAAGSMLRETDSEYSAKHVEIIYRERVRREKEKAMQVQLDLEDQLHKKTNLDMLLKRALKEKADLLVKNTALTSENAFLKLEKAKLEKATARLQAELKTLQARADELERALTLTDVMQEVLRLQRLLGEKSAALDETRAVHADTVRALALLQDSAEDMAARLQRSVPRARLRWQRSRLTLTLDLRKKALRDVEADAEDLRNESVATEQTSRKAVDKALEERDAISNKLDDEKEKTQLLSTALSQASESVAALRKQEGSLVMTAREAYLRMTELDAYVQREVAEAQQSKDVADKLRAELQRARWEIAQAAESEAKLRETLYLEQARAKNADEALEAARMHAGIDPDELRLRAKAAAAEAAAATQAAIELSQQSLREAAEARSEREALAGRCRMLERHMRAAESEAPRRVLRPSASVPRVPPRAAMVTTLTDPMSKLHASGRLPLPLTSPASGAGGAGGGSTVRSAALTPSALNSLINTLADPAPLPNSKLAALTTTHLAPRSALATTPHAPPASVRPRTPLENALNTPLALGRPPTPGRRSTGSLMPARPSGQVATGLIPHKVERVWTPPSGVAGGPPASLVRAAATGDCDGHYAIPRPPSGSPRG